MLIYLFGSLKKSTVSDVVPQETVTKLSGLILFSLPSFTRSLSSSGSIDSLRVKFQCFALNRSAFSQFLNIAVRQRSVRVYFGYLNRNHQVVCVDMKQNPGELSCRFGLDILQFSRKRKKKKFKMWVINFSANKMATTEG
ncbi:hypothetical protein CEXT_726251 [Caerostris extrusa]|uniref:Uncharacterized protein n=1 Tax=Caerostris extrusa TaxID=172846 RepID=A0AAV4XC19_CAEEX|nr:hypothetical protein CEXT_726251 [Caerostris extrusa]